MLTDTKGRKSLFCRTLEKSFDTAAEIELPRFAIMSSYIQYPNLAKSLESTALD